MRMATSIPDIGKSACELPEKGGQRTQMGVRREEGAVSQPGKVASPSRCPGRLNGAVS